MSDAQMLDVESLLAEARAATGLSDFGDPWFLMPLARLVAAVNVEAGLIAPDAGAGARIKGALADRLQLQQFFKDHPAAADEHVALGCAIVGLPRTGSTAMHRLLASVPKLTALWWWETAFPLPFADEKPTDPSPRQAAGRQMVDWLLSEWPDFESIDPMDAMAINEEVVLLDRTFLSTTYDAAMPIHSYGHWQFEQDHAPAYRDLYRFLQAIQFQRVQRGEPRRPWVLKTPHHVLGGIEGLLRIWPDAKLVMTHRDVAQVLPSWCSMCCSLTITSSTRYHKLDQGAHWTRRFRRGLDQFEAIRARLPDHQVIDVQYAETVSDPAGTAQRVLTALGFPPDLADRAAIAQSITENAREARPRHKYAASDFGLSDAGIAQDFADYHAKYLGKGTA